MGLGPRLDTRPCLGDPKPTMRTVEALFSPDHPGATGRAGFVASNMLAIDEM